MPTGPAHTGVMDIATPIAERTTIVLTFMGNLRQRRPQLSRAIALLFRYPRIHRCRLTSYSGSGRMKVRSVANRAEPVLRLRAKHFEEQILAQNRLACASLRTD